MKIFSWREFLWIWVAILIGGGIVTYFGLGSAGEDIAPWRDWFITSFNTGVVLLVLWFSNGMKVKKV